MEQRRYRVSAFVHVLLLVGLALALLGLVNNTSPYWTHEAKQTLAVKVKMALCYYSGVMMSAGGLIFITGLVLAWVQYGASRRCRQDMASSNAHDSSSGKGPAA